MLWQTDMITMQSVFYIDGISNYRESLELLQSTWTKQIANRSIMMYNMTLFKLISIILFDDFKYIWLIAWFKRIMFVLIFQSVYYSLYETLSIYARFYQLQYIILYRFNSYSIWLISQILFILYSYDCLMCVIITF